MEVLVAEEIEVDTDQAEAVGTAEAGQVAEQDEILAVAAEMVDGVAEAGEDPAADSIDNCILEEVRLYKFYPRYELC